MSNFEFSKFKKISQSSDEILSQIKKEKEGLISFGLDFLDKTLVGIFKDDLIVLGGRSGAGKTELALHIAMSAALQGKKVYYFALEAHKNEIAMRLVYRQKAKEYFSSMYIPAEEKVFVSYDRWASGLLPERFYENIDRICEEFKGLDNLNVMYSSSDFTIEDFLKTMPSIRQDAGLVVIDHLHYFELRDGENENAEYKRIVKSIRQECLEKEIPVLLVSHIRKPDTRSTYFVPDQEDFHGSSDIVKIATKAITIGPGMGRIIITESGEDLKPNGKYVSFMKAAKNRRNGSVTYATAVVMFDPQTNEYTPGFLLGEPAWDKDRKCVVFQTKKKKDYPKWSK